MGKHKCPGSGLSNTIGRFGMRKHQQLLTAGSADYITDEEIFSLY